MMTNVAKKLKAALLSAAVVMACAGQAQAASFQGDWDPAFGSPFFNLGWEGTVLFTVPDECLTAQLDGTITVTNASSCAAGGIDLTSAVVRFYRLVDDTPGVNEPVATLTYTGNFDPGTPDTKVTIENGVVTALRADFNEWVFPNPTLTEAGWPLPGKSFNLEFLGDCALLRFRTEFKSEGNQQPDGGTSDKCKETGGEQSGPFLQFSRVGVAIPEPGSLALLLPAVGLLAAFRRRRPVPAAA